MKVYLITYNLKKVGKDYSDFKASCKSFKKWWHYIDTSWLVATDMTANDVYNHISKHLDEGDFLLVIEVKANYQGWLPQKAHDWMLANIS